MSNKYPAKNKWKSQRISKIFKNRHLNDDYRDPPMSVKEDAQSIIDRYIHEPYDDDLYFTNNSRKILPSWTCNRCTYHNIERNSHCTICQFPFNSNHTCNTPTSPTYSSHQNAQNTDITMGEYLEPILTQLEAKQNDFDQQMQFAIASSLEEIATDSDDTDTSDTSNTSSQTNTSITNRKQRRIKKRGSSFASYWREMAEYHAMFNKNLKYIIKQNKKRLQEDEEGTNSLWKDHGHINSSAFKLIKKYPGIMDRVPNMNQIYEWLGTKYNVKECSIKNIITHYVLQKFIKNGRCKRGQFEIVYHGTRSCVAQSIIQNGLIVGGTKGVPIRTGAAYGNGVYCSPSLSTAWGYERGALFICLVRRRRVRKSGTIYVCPNDSDILPVYLASFSYNGTWIANNSLFKFEPGWKPLNLDLDAKKKRRVRRKWSAYHKLNE